MKISHEDLNRIANAIKYIREISYDKLVSSSNENFVSNFTAIFRENGVKQTYYSGAVTRFLESIDILKINRVTIKNYTYQWVGDSDYDYFNLAKESIEFINLQLKIKLPRKLPVVCKAVKFNSNSVLDKKEPTTKLVFCRSELYLDKLCYLLHNSHIYQGMITSMKRTDDKRIKLIVRITVLGVFYTEIDIYSTEIYETVDELIANLKSKIYLFTDKAVTLRDNFNNIDHNIKSS